MLIDINIFALMLLTVMFLTMSCLVLLFFTSKLYRKIVHLEKREHQVDRNLEHRTQGILEKAYSQSEELLKGAQEQAEDIRSDATISSGKELAQELEKGLHLILAQASKDIQSEMPKYLAGFSEKLTQDYLEAKNKLDSEMEQKKQQQGIALEQKVVEKVDKLSRQILGQSISLLKHEQLVKQALEKAKEEIFSE